MRSLINVVLFVLVLFGSAGPASAQSEVGGMTADVWAALIGFGTLVLTVVIIGLMIKNSNDAAHTKIEKNVKKVEENLKADINRVEDGVNDNFKGVNDNFNRLFLELGKVIGKQSRESQTDDRTTV